MTDVGYNNGNFTLSDGYLYPPRTGRYEIIARSHTAATTMQMFIYSSVNGAIGGIQDYPTTGAYADAISWRVSQVQSTEHIGLYVYIGHSAPLNYADLYIEEKPTW